MSEEMHFEEDQNAKCKLWQAGDLDLDLGSGRKVHIRVAHTEYYLDTKFHHDRTTKILKSSTKCMSSVSSIRIRDLFIGKDFRLTCLQSGRSDF